MTKQRYRPILKHHQGGDVFRTFKIQTMQQKEFMASFNNILKSISVLGHLELFVTLIPLFKIPDCHEEMIAAYKSRLNEINLTDEFGIEQIILGMKESYEKNYICSAPLSELFMKKLISIELYSYISHQTYNLESFFNKYNDEAKKKIRETIGSSYLEELEELLTKVGLKS